MFTKGERGSKWQFCLYSGANIRKAYVWCISNVEKDAIWVRGICLAHWNPVILATLWAWIEISLLRLKIVFENIANEYCEVLTTFYMVASLNMSPQLDSGRGENKKGG